VGRPRLAVAASLAAAALGAAGCGNDRTPAPAVPPPAAPVGKRTVDLGFAGVTFRRPANWVLTRGTAPMLATVASGRAVVVVWRYARAEPLPTAPQALERSRRALIAAARARDRTLRVDSSRVLSVGGAKAVEVVADEQLGIARRQVRSTHVYAHGAELVLDAYAPPAEFARVDRTVFRPLLRSLTVKPPGPPA
jgi:hypothetical protein